MANHEKEKQLQPGSLGPVEANIRSVAELERAFEGRKNFVERVSDAIAGFSGSIFFVGLHILWFVVWFSINCGAIPGIPKFDPYPFILLCMIVSVEGVLLSTFVLMKQNRMQRRTDQRDQLNLQIGLLSEKEVTKILQVLRLICHKIGVNEAELDKELEEMSRTTSVDHLAARINTEMPSSH